MAPPGTYGTYDDKACRTCGKVVSLNQAQKDCEECRLIPKAHRMYPAGERACKRCGETKMMTKGSIYCKECSAKTISATYPAGKRECFSCKQVKHIRAKSASCWHCIRKNRGDLSTRKCIKCTKERLHWSGQTWCYLCLKYFNARTRHRTKKGASEDYLTFEEYIDIIDFTDVCPDTNMKFEDENPISLMHRSMDRIDNSKAYTKDNVRVTSVLANIVRNARSMDEWEVEWNETLEQLVHANAERLGYTRSTPPSA